MKPLRLSERAFRALLRLYPQEFREAFGEEMERTFRDLLRDGAAGGHGGTWALWVRTLVDILVGAVRERGETAMRISRLEMALLPAAVVIGLAIAWVDSRPTWDDTGITVGAILLICACLGGVAPRRAWRWALAVGVWIPIYGIVVSRDCNMILAFAPALIGAYVGAGVRRVIDPTAGTA